MSMIRKFAEQNGWELNGQTADAHFKFTWTSSEGVAHTVVTGNPKKLKGCLAEKSAVADFKRCMRGQCRHQVR